MKSLFSGYTTLLKTTLGSGILSFPHLFSTYGIIPNFILSAVCAFFAFLSLYTFSICSQKTGRSASLFKLTQESIPYARIFVDFAVFMKCFGVAASYLIIARQLLPLIINEFVEFNHPNAALLMFVSVFGPIAYFKKLDKLRYTSFAGLVCILFVIVTSVYKLHIFSSQSLVKIQLFETPSYGWLSGLGKSVFAYTCHMNFFTVHNEIHDNTVENTKWVILPVVLSAFVAYNTFGLSNYLIYGSTAHDNILENYEPGRLTLITRICYVFVMAFSYPLQVNPARIYFLNVFYYRPGKNNEKLTNFVVSTLIVAITTLIAVRNINLGMLYAIVGSTSSTLMCLIFPAMFYLNMDLERSGRLVFLVYIAFLFGAFVFTTSIISLAFNMIK